MTPLRRRVAERLVAAQHEAALLTTFNEIDMGAVKELRRDHQEVFQAKYGIKLGFMSFFVKALIEALKAVPQLNAEIRDDKVVFRNFYDIGVAVGGGKGLVVPVIRNAERLGFAQVERAIADYAEKARTGRIDLADLQGGTFTISNGGIYGSLLSTPIVNPPPERHPGPPRHPGPARRPGWTGGDPAHDVCGPHLRPPHRGRPGGGGLPAARQGVHGESGADPLGGMKWRSRNMIWW